MMRASTLLLLLPALVLVSVSLAPSALAAKIIAMPYPGGVSHVFIMAKIGRELAERGHDVTLVVASLDAQHAESRTKGSAVQTLPYDGGIERQDIENVTLQCTKEDPISCSVRVTESCVAVCRKLFANEAVLSQIKDAELVITDISYPCGYMFVDKFNIPYRVEVSPVGFYDPWGAMHWGIPSPPAIVPQLGSRLSNKMSFAERIHNTIVQGVLYFVTPKLDEIADRLRVELNIPKTHTASARSSGMYLLNVDWATEFPRPITPVTKVVGPILPQAPALLPMDLSQWMDSASNGVLVVSLGTLAEVVLTDQIVNSLAALFSSLPVHVLWKLQRPTPAGIAANVRTVKWFPQNDVLGHPRTRAFLTHGGMNSVQEAAFHGVPMLGFPLFADQFDNVLRMVAAGTAVQLPASVADPAFKETVLLLLQDPSFKAKAMKISARMKDRLNTPTQEAADWIEFSLRNDNGQHLRVPSLDMPWWQAANLDVYATFSVLVLALLFLVYKLLKRVVGGTVALAAVLGGTAFLLAKVL